MKAGGREGPACLQKSQCLSYPSLQKWKGQEEGLEEGEMQDLLVMEEDIIVYFPLSFFPLVLFLCSSFSEVLPTKKK